VREDNYLLHPPRHADVGEKVSGNTPPAESPFPVPGDTASESARPLHRHRVLQLAIAAGVNQRGRLAGVRSRLPI
jgi:hypothetical protein